MEIKNVQWQDKKKKLWPFTICIDEAKEQVT